MFNSLTSLFKQLLEGQDLGKNANVSPNLAIASLLCEVAGADHQINEAEQQAKLGLLQRLVNIDVQQAADLLVEANEKVKESVSFIRFHITLKRAISRKTFRINQRNVGSSSCRWGN